MAPQAVQGDREAEEKVQREEKKQSHSPVTRLFTLKQPLTGTLASLRALPATLACPLAPLLPLSLPLPLACSPSLSLSSIPQPVSQGSLLWLAWHVCQERDRGQEGWEESECADVRLRAFSGSEGTTAAAVLRELLVILESR